MEKRKYHPQVIEKKWQKFWEENKTFITDIDHSKEKYYILDMFPYPSGAGLHVGHVTGYTATDIVARQKRQKGYNVLHPMAWDSFGLPAEQYAVRTGTHPAITTEKNIDTYRRQLKMLGLSYDWSREFATSDPKYYKWTQWIFTKLYEQGLAYEAEALVNYCPALRTVLANEEVENGVSKEGGHPVERRPLRQWILKITAYAEKLLADLDDLDWPDYLKRMQRQWIGKSEGVNIDFPAGEEKIRVFTTCPETMRGVSFLVISPEHPLVDKITTNENRDAVEAYKKATSMKSDMQRTELNKEKTGVFTGGYAKNPLTGEEIPVWIADYVLMSYGTGAVMAVPFQDERDQEFAKVYGLNIPEFEADESITEQLVKQGSAEKVTQYRLRDWLFSRQRYWGEPMPILHFEDGTMRPLDVDELPLTLPEMEDFKPAEDGASPLAKAKEWIEVTDPKTGKKAKREINVMPQWGGSCWYYLRFCDPQNGEMAWDKEKEKYWMPVDLYVGGVEHAVLHLLYSRFWHKVLFDLGLVSTKEPFQSLRNQGLLTAYAYKKGANYVEPENADSSCTKSLEKMSKSKLNGVPPDEICEEYGADTLRLYEMFMAPFDKEKLWDPQAISGCHRFMQRFHDMVFSEKICDDEEKEAMKLAHRLLYGVTKDIENLSFNTAIAKMMEFLNAFIPLKSYPRKALLMAVQALYPFAPHFAEEAFEYLTGKQGITYEPLLPIDEKLLVDDTTTYVGQVNGKVRARFDLPKGLSKEDLLEKLKGDANAANFLEGEIVKVIFVPNKLINVVVK